MGLDWVLVRRKPKRGAANEFQKLAKELRELKQPGKAATKGQKQLESRLDAISVRAEDVIGAPRVGIDESATLWWLEHVYAPNFERAALKQGEPASVAHWLQPKEKLLRADRGKYVCELAKEQGGRNRLVGWSLVSDIDYPGMGILGHPEFEFLGELSTEAWVDHSAKDAARYAGALETALQRAVRKGELGPGNAAHATVRHAIDWLKFWSERGFGFHAWS